MDMVTITVGVYKVCVENGLGEMRIGGVFSYQFLL